MKRITEDEVVMLEFIPLGRRKENLVLRAIKTLKVGEILYVDGEEWPWLTDPRSTIHQALRGPITGRKYMVRGVSNRGPRDFIVGRLK